MYFKWYLDALIECLVFFVITDLNQVLVLILGNNQSYLK